MKVPFQKSTDGEKTWMDGTIFPNSYDHLKEHSQKKKQLTPATTENWDKITYRNQKYDPYKEHPEN